MKLSGSDIIRIALIVILIAVSLAWELSYPHLDAAAQRWGSPSRILGILAEWFLSGYIFEHLSPTLAVTTVGLLIGAVAGSVLAYTFHAIRALDSSLTPVMVWLNALPRIVLVPLFIALLGIGAISKVLMVVAMTVFIFFFSVREGLRSVDPRVIRNAKLLGAGSRELVAHVYVPYVLTWLTAALRPGVGFAMIGAIISEYMGSTAGLGYVIDLAYGNDDYARVVAGLLVTGVVAGLLDTCARGIQRIVGYCYLGQRWEVAR